MFVGISNLHSSDVPLILNLQTGSITPQFHVVFDDYFTTVASISDDDNPPDVWEDLCLENSLHIATEDNNQENTLDSFIYLNDDWLTNEELRAKQRAAVRTSSISQAYGERQVPARASDKTSSWIPEHHLQHNNDEDRLPETTNVLPSREQPNSPISIEPPSTALISREEVTTTIHPDVIHNNLYYIRVQR
jgi:hypothetical protein